MKITKKHLISIFVILIPIVINIIIYCFPETAKENLIFKKDEITLLNLYFSSFTHLEWKHLLPNLIGYLLFLIPSFLLFSSLGETDRFIDMLLLILVLSPFLISIFWAPLNIFYLQNISSSQGFSGIVASTLGLLIVSFSYYIYRKTSVKYSLILGALIVLELFYIFLIYFKGTYFNIITFVLICSLFFLMLWLIRRDTKNKDTQPFVNALKSSKVELCIFLFAVMVILLVSQQFKP